MKSIVVLGFTLSLCACVSSPAPRSLSVYQGQVQLRGAQLGSTQESIINTGAQQFSMQPTCEARNVGLGDSRKGFRYEVCAFFPTSQEFANAPLAEATYHFIDSELVRVDMRVKGGEQLAKEIANDFDQWLIQRLTNAEDKPSYQWQFSDQLVGVRAASGGNAGNVFVRLLEADLLRKAPWLAQE